MNGQTNKTGKKKKEEYVRLPYFGLNRLLPFLKPYRKRLAVMMLLGVVSSAIDIVFPLFQKYALDNYIADGILTGLPYFVGLYILTLAVRVASDFVTTYSATRVEVMINHDLRRTCFDHLQTLSFTYFNQNSVGYIHSRIMSDTSRIGSLVSWVMMDSVWHTTYIIGAVAVMFSINVKLALAVVMIVPLAIVLIAL